MNPDGSMPTNLTNNAATDSTPLWDPTGERIAFLSDRSGTQELYTMAADGSDVLNVSVGQAQEPAWSRDGTRLAFTSTRTGNPEIYVAPSHGGAVRRLTSMGANAPARPTWSPDGSRIAFEAAGRIYVMNADGTSPVPVSQGAPRGDHEPAWSPTGTQIAFARGLSLENWDVVVMNSDGTGVHDISSNTSSSSVEHVTAWSSDGTEVLGEAGEGNSGSPVFGIGVYIAAASGASFNYGALPPAEKPCLSADGGSILFDSSKTGNDEVFIAPRGGGTAVNLTNSAGSDTQCSMRPR